MALIWSKKSTGVPIRVKTSHVTGGTLNDDGDRRIGDKISECVLDIGKIIILDSLLQPFSFQSQLTTFYIMVQTFTKTVPESSPTHNPPTIHPTSALKYKSSSRGIGLPTNHELCNTCNNWPSLHRMLNLK